MILSEENILFLPDVGKLKENETLAEDFLLEQGILKVQRKCPCCGSINYDRLNRLRIGYVDMIFKCKDCFTQWDLAKDSILEALPTSAGRFLGCLACFSEGLTEGYAAVHVTMSAWKYYPFFRLLIAQNKKLPIIKGKELKVYVSYHNEKIKIGLKKTNAPDLAELRLTRSRDQYGYIFKIDYKRIRKLKRKGIGRIDEIEYFYRMCQKRVLNYMGGKELRDVYLNLLEVEYRHNLKRVFPFTDIINSIRKRKLNASKVGKIFSVLN